MGTPALSADEIDDAGAIVRDLGMRPTSQIEIYAFCKARVDHRILGEIALHLAMNAPGSVISFGGDLSPHRSVGGKLLSIPYETVGSAYAVASYGDCEFLRSWLRQPCFFMIK